MLFKLPTKVANMFHAFTAFIMAFLLTTQANANNGYNFDNLVDSGQTLDDINSNIEGYSQTTFNMIKAVGVLAGIIFVFAGVLRLKKSQDPNSGVSPVQGIALIVIGGLCAVLPWLLITSASTVSRN